MRVKFEKGKQREFLLKVMASLNCLSLSELGRRLDFNYSTLKNYFSEKRFLPNDLFDSLCEVSGISARVVFVEDNWGQVKGGRKFRKKRS